MAALALAHIPALLTMPRSAARVLQLFQVLRSACTPLNLDPSRAGAGLPTLHSLVPIMKAAAMQTMGRGAEFAPQAAGPGFTPDLVNQLTSAISDALIRAFAAAPGRVGIPTPEAPVTEATDRGQPPQRRAKS
jgi:hypothetical protein